MRMQNSISGNGDMWSLGDHRLMCGDSTSPNAVRKLMDGGLANLCFTSPPYMDQRVYNGRKSGNWDDMMASVFSVLPLTKNGQVLVNLGMIHGANEWHPYWNGWLETMREVGFRRFGLYVWDAGWGLPGDWSGRLAPSFEFIFHFNNAARKANKVVAKKPENIAPIRSMLRLAKDRPMGIAAPESGMATHKIPDSVLRIHRQTHRAKAVESEHPAVFPVELPKLMIETYTDAGEIVFEPFSGSGTTMIAAERSGRKCYGMELEPIYVDIAIERWTKETGQEAFRDDGVKFSDLAQPRRKRAA